jgi:hypothetical protein
MQSDFQALLGTGHAGPEGEYRYGSTLSLNLALDGGGLTTPHPGSFNPGKETWYPLHRRVGGPQDQSAWVWNILPPLEFDPWTVQSLVSHYTNYAILKSALHKKNLWASNCSFPPYEISLGRVYHLTTYNVPTPLFILSVIYWEV